jgi:hypothetical protein
VIGILLVLTLGIPSANVALLEVYIQLLTQRYTNVQQQTLLLFLASGGSRAVN